MAADPDAAWRAAWLDAVVSGGATMSQRAASTIEAHGGIAALVEDAQARGVHLVRLTDDHGRVLVAASTAPFETLC